MKILIIFFIIMHLFAFEKIFSFEADFKQVITTKNGKNIRYSGKIYFKFNNNQKILWIYKKPILKKIYILDKKINIIEPELEQVIITGLDSNYNLIKILKNAKKIDKNLYKAKIGNVIYEIQLAKNKIKSIKFSDELQNNNKINFFNIKQNIQLKDEIFEFNIPYDYDVVSR